MSYIVVDELITTLSQTFYTKYDRIYHIAGIKINVLMYNAPSGTFTLTLKDSGGNSLASDTFTSAEIKTALSTSDNYAIANVPITFFAPIKKGTYSLELSSSGYTYSSSSFIGWIKSHENIYNSLESAPSDFTENPFNYLIYEKVREDLVR